MNILSLFDGISCGQVALEKANVPVEKYYASEIDKDAIKVAQNNYPKTIQLGDVNQINFEQFIGKIDLIIGGSPCQDLSIAKQNREGLDGVRSGLFFKFVEALKIIKPRYFLLENNASMSNENKNKISEILGLQPILIDSADFSAQIRKRLYWTNIPFIPIFNKNNLTIRNILERDINRKVYSCAKYKDTVKYTQYGIKWDCSGKGYYSQQNRARYIDTKMNTIPASGTDKNNIYRGGITIIK
jgi:DNA (cytosine-5)-methyltransferase 3A